MRSRPIGIALAVFVWTAAVAQAAGFKVTGEMSYWSVKGTNYSQILSWTFEASVLGQGWLQTTHLTNQQNLIHGGDGENVYLLYEDDLARKRLNMKTYNGTVFKGTYPVCGPNLFTTLPWLAYCSGTFMKINVTNRTVMIPAPWLAAWSMPIAHIYKGVYEELPGSDGLPLRMEYLPDHDRMQEIAHGDFHTVVGVASGMAYDIDTITNQRKSTRLAAMYQVLAFTNYQGVVVPSEFQFDTYYLPAPGNFIAPAGSGEREPEGRVQGRLTSLEIIAELDPLPRASSNVTGIAVCDFRFYDSANNVAGVRYIARNSAWITNQSSPYLQKLYKRAKSKKPNPYFQKLYQFATGSIGGQSTLKAHRFVIPLLFLVAVAAFIRFVVGRK